MSKKSSGGISFFSLLTLLFIGLKLVKVIDWSWWWVLAPVWMPIALLVLAIVFIALVHAFND